MNKENALDSIPAILPSAGPRKPEPPHPPDVKTVLRHGSAGRAERL